MVDMATTGLSIGEQTNNWSRELGDVGLEWCSSSNSNINPSLTEINASSSHSSLKQRGKKADRILHTRVYLGETINYNIIVKKSLSKSEHEQKQEVYSDPLTLQSVSNDGIGKEDCSEKDSEQSESDLSQWQGKVSKLSCQADIQSLKEQQKKQNSTNDTKSSKAAVFTMNVKTEDLPILSPVLATFVGSSDGRQCIPSTVPHASCDTHSGYEKSMSMEPYFQEKDTFVIPMSTAVHDVPSGCCRVKLIVTLSLFSVGPGINNKLQEDSKERQKESLKLKEENFTLPQKTKVENPVSGTAYSALEHSVSTLLSIQSPPELKVKHSSVGIKELLLLSVENNTDRQMVIKSLQIVSSSSPVTVTSNSSAPMLWEDSHQLLSLVNSHHSFPAILQPGERFNLVYSLHLSSVPSDTELGFRANVKWTHAGASNEISTVYSLPKIRVRCPPFVVMVQCDEEADIDQMFYVTYTISNQLHDFMSMKLYYNLDNMQRTLKEQGGTDEEFERVENLANSMVCHDPDTALSSCPRGTTVPVKVGFQIHKPGVYELSELMKVNLRYSLPDSRGNLSTDTSLSVQSSIDYHLQSSEELWRDRSGSTASLAVSLPVQSAEERRKSFAAKSYSFGDMGPTGSSHSEDQGSSRNKIIKRSSAVPPVRPPPPRMLSQCEKDLVRPSNFLKRPFYIYIRDPLQ